ALQQRRWPSWLGGYPGTTAPAAQGLHGREIYPQSADHVATARIREGSAWNSSRSGRPVPAPRAGPVPLGNGNGVVRRGTWPTSAPRNAARPWWSLASPHIALTRSRGITSGA